MKSDESSDAFTFFTFFVSISIFFRIGFASIYLSLTGSSSNYFCSLIGSIILFESFKDSDF